MKATAPALPTSPTSSEGTPAGFFGPGAFSNKFLLFTFTNSLASNQTNYSWVETTSGTRSNSCYDAYVTFGRWAYQNAEIGDGCDFRLNGLPA